MIILDLQTGKSHEYGTNPHDSLVVSEDGRTLNYYNLQNGDGSRFGDYRFIVGDEIERYWNIGGFKPERKKGTPLLEKREWIDGYENRWYRKKFYCASCGIKIRTESWNEKRCFGEGTILQDNNMPNFCPNCGADIREEQDGKSD